MATKVKSAIKNRDINGLFNDIVGDGTVAPNIAYDKFTKLKDNLMSLLSLLENFSKGSFSKTYKDYEIPMAEILLFAQKGKKEVETCMPAPPFTEMQIMQGLSSDGREGITMEQISQFSDRYKKAKTMGIIADCVKTCNQLIKYRMNLIKKNQDGKNNPDGLFIRSAPGSVFSPLPFTSFNVKEAFIRQDMTEHYRNYMLMMLAMTFEYTYNIYHVYTSPDWDPIVFAEIMKANIDAVKKRIPRCEKAFKKVEESLGLLETNMDSYYRDFVSTKNPSIMLESFVNDVANENGNTDPQTARQFREIITYYKKMSSGKINDPRIKTLFDQVNSLAGDSILADRGATDDNESEAESDTTASSSSTAL